MRARFGIRQELVREKFARGRMPIMRAARRFWILGVVFIPRWWQPTDRAGQSAERRDAETKDEPYVVEYYYKAKWGHAEEFLRCSRKIIIRC